MRYDAAPRTERAPTAPAKAVEIKVLRVTRLMEQSFESYYFDRSILPIVRLWFFFTPGDPWIDPLTAAPNKVQDYVARVDRLKPDVSGSPWCGFRLRL